MEALRTGYHHPHDGDAHGRCAYRLVHNESAGSGADCDVFPSVRGAEEYQAERAHHHPLSRGGTHVESPFPPPPLLS